MTQYLYLLFVLIATCYAEEKLGGKVQVVKDVNEYLSKNPDTKLKPLQYVIVGPRQTLHYTIGNRVADDLLLAQGGETFTFPIVRDYAHKIWHPIIGIGARISMVDLWVDQTSSNCNVYVIGGGVGHRSITVLIESKQTTLFSYRASIYGY